MNSRDKGQRGELELAEYLRERGHPEARRGQQFKGGVDSPDVVGFDPRFHPECKRCERGNPYDWLTQAERDASGQKIPVVMHRRNRKRWLAIMYLDDFLEVARNGN